MNICWPLRRRQVRKLRKCSLQTCWVPAGEYTFAWQPWIIQVKSFMMATPRKSQYAGPATRFSTLREAWILSVFIAAMCVVSLAFSSCISPSREGLPHGSPFTDQVELEKPSLPDGTAVGDITSHSAELWLKTQGPKHIQVEWASVEAWKRISAMASVQSPAARTPPVLTGSETDFTLTVSFDHLLPGTRYRYYVLVKDPDQHEKEARPQVAAQGEFTTLPD